MYRHNRQNHGHQYVSTGSYIYSLTVNTGWNMGNAPPERSFDRIIPFGGGQYDIVAFGLQEATWSVPLKKKMKWI